MSIRGILFDKDGTLLDYHATWMPVNREMALRVARGNRALARRLLISGGYDTQTRRVRAGSLLAAGNTLEIARGWHPQVAGLWRDQAALVAALDAGFVELSARSATPVTNLAPLLDRLRARGIQLGVATADSEAGIHASLGDLGIIDRFEFLGGYDSGYAAKPDPELVHAFMRGQALAAAEVMMVGDNRHDLEMGRAAGAGCVVGVLTGTSPKEVLDPLADHVLADITELEALLDRFGSTGTTPAAG